MAQYGQKNPPRPLEPFTPPPGRYRDAVVIPVLAEEERIDGTLEALHAAAGASEALILLAVNHADGTDPVKRADNLRLLRRLRAAPPPGVFWQELALPGDGGVGWGRKIGLDSVWFLVDGLLFSLDADTGVEADYFTATRAAFAAHPEWGGAVLRFRHPRPDDPELARAIQLYEAYLDHYVAGLRRAGSPYAYQTMGSAMVCRPAAYVRCGGMRTHSGGEDFYFLQALRKTVEVGEIDGTTVHPAARPSDRVPFGTGPRLRELMAGGVLPEYTAEGFEELRILLAEVASGDPLEFGAVLPGLSAPIGAYLTGQNFAAAWAGILRNTPKNDAARRRAFHCWFDAFRTLKFLRTMLY